ncbi:MAG: hypothetical protein KJO04_01690 [Bacteroidia bacterium]|nr:hypothetical protein [Bacteroidia bacterium]
MSKLLILLSLLSSAILRGQTDTTQLIQPTGKFGVGTVLYEWTDKTRDLKFTSHEGDKRTILVQLWYPAAIDSNSVKAPYSALSKDYQKTITNSYLRPSFNPEVEISNLVIIAPGRGTERFLYTTIAEELASHGYSVASVDMPEIGYTIYSDGFIIKPSKKFQPPRGMMGGPYEKVDQFFEVPTDIGFQDLQFAYEKIKELCNADPNGRFTNKIDTENIGLFGHSLGGRIAGLFAAKTNTVKGYVSMEGIPPRDIRYNGKMDMPIALLCSSGTWPYAKDNYFSIIDNRSNPVYMIELDTFGHNSVTDNPYLYPDSFNYEIDPEIALEISRNIVLTYFNAIFETDLNLMNSIKSIRQVKMTVHD